MPVCSTCGTHYGVTVRICVRDGTPLVAGRADDPHLGKLLDDKYRIESFISGGGMGAVYRAQHVMLGKTVAVKVIKPELVTSDEVVTRFQREARAASNLDHSNIVTVYDLGQTPEGTLYIAMEFIDGPSLRDAIRREGPLAPGRAIDILRQVASALSAAHRKQIVHRDLKSHNLMLAADDRGRDVVKLVDFGIAKTFDESTQLTAAGYMLGTPHYMSPEQAAGKPVDHRADLYSLGVILYEMLTGQVPFNDDSLTSVLLKLATEVPPPPSARRPDLTVPPALEAVAMRCLEKDPADRFQSAEEFAEALERAGADVDTQRVAAAAPIVAAPVAATLLRQPAAGRSPNRQGAAAKAPVSDGVPSARARSGLSMPGQIDRRVAVVLVVIAAIGAAIASGIGMSDDPDDVSRPSANTTVSNPVTVNAPAPAPQPSPAALAVPPASAGSPAPATVVPEDDRPRVETTPEPARVRVPAPAPPPPVASREPATSAPRTAGQTPAPAAAREQAPGPLQQAPAADPSVYVTCKGFPDVCSVIRAEMARAFQRDGLVVMNDRGPAQVGVTAAVTLVSETTSADFGVPMLTRTYSVELIGDARGASVAMPDPRRFSYDARVGSERLTENARLIAAGAVESVRAFLSRQRP
jgi:serine/threonine protein kinase